MQLPQTSRSNSSPLKPWLPVLAAILAFALSGPALHALAIVRGPYLGRFDDTSITVIWQTDDTAEGEVRLFDDQGRQVSAIPYSANNREQRVRFDNVTPGALYRYEILAGGELVYRDGSVRAPLARQARAVRFAVFGDTDGETPRFIADLLVERDLRLALHTGDVVYPSGAAEDYDSKFFKPFQRWLERGVILPTLGNHDAMTKRGAPMLQNFVLPANGDPESRYYSVREGDALFICLDVETSSFGLGSEQYRWLEQTLRESDAAWKFVWFHEPPYSSANSNQIIRFVLGPLFEAQGVDIVFCGHEHMYERTVPIRDFATASRGVVYITAGGGGAGFTRFVRQERAAAVAARHGVVVIDIDGTRLTGYAVDADGTVFDQFRIAKGAGRERAVRGGR